MEGRLSIGAVLSGAFSTIGSNPLATLGLSFVLGVLPSLLFSYFLTGPISSASTVALLGTPGGIALYLGSLALMIICAMLVQATLVRVTVAHALGESASLGSSLGMAMAKILPLLGLTILMVLGLAAGTLLLVIPGIILYFMWIVASPALVAEDIGIIEAFGRSRALTSGHRWKIFGLMLVVGVIMWILSAVVGVVVLATGGTAGLLNSAATGTLPVGFMILTAVVNTFSTAFSSTTIARLYVELRIAKEGPMTDALADVFA